MKTYVTHMFIIVIGLLGYLVYKQSEVKRQDDIERVVQDPNQPLSLADSNRARY